jgi:hypothetical protein
MTSSALQTSSGVSLTELWKTSEPESSFYVAALLALGLHLGFALWAPAHPALRAPAAPPVEVEIVLREPPPPAPAPSVEPAAPPAAAPAPARPVVARAAPPPPAAAAPAVLTAAPTAPEAQTSEPFDFTSDPRSTSFSSGVVAVGGTAKHGLAGAELGGSAPEPRRAARGDGLTAASDLSQTPRLRRADPCHGFFPKSARDDVASAVVRVVVDTEGVVSRVSVVSETPPGQGFGVAARTCLLEQSFVPALDREGRAAATAVNVNVHFNR